MPISCHFHDCKALLFTHVNSAISSIQTFYLFIFVVDRKKWRLNLELCVVVLPLTESLINSKSDM